jgi:bleomycin hydrolase
LGNDVSEPYFSYKNGVAYVPDIDLDQINAENKQTLFTEPKKDKTITEDMRQKALTTFLQRMITVCIS